jgi:hypothetical protein
MTGQPGSDLWEGFCATTVIAEGATRVVLVFGFFVASAKGVTTSKSLAPASASGDRPGVAMTT